MIYKLPPEQATGDSAKPKLTKERIPKPVKDILSLQHNCSGGIDINVTCSQQF
jgi:hypothetical protein